MTLKGSQNWTFSFKWPLDQVWPPSGAALLPWFNGLPFSVKATKDSKNPMVFNLSKPNLLEAQDPKAHVNKSYVTTQKL